MLNGAALTALRQKLAAAARQRTYEVELVYLLGQTEENQSSVLDVAPAFETIAIAGHESLSGYPGFSSWKRELLGRGIPQDRIIGITGSIVTVGNKEMFHTLSEMTALVRYAKAHGLRRIAIIAPEWHLLRAFMSIATVVMHEYPELKVSPVFGKPLPWDEASVHSQGLLKGTRTDFIFEETVRVYAYNEKGDIADPELVLKYLQSYA